MAKSGDKRQELLHGDRLAAQILAYMDSGKGSHATGEVYTTRDIVVGIGRKPGADEGNPVLKLLHRMATEVPPRVIEYPKGSNRYPGYCWRLHMGANIRRKQSRHSLPLAPSSLCKDLTDLICRKGVALTVKQRLVDARLGQGVFRTNVLQHWESRCSVTRSETLAAIRASHIKPWRDSADDERLDPLNGLPLIASLDALFDAGLISFNASGQLLLSPDLHESERRIFDLNGKRLAKTPPPETAKYLAHHREFVFRNGTDRR